MKYTAIILILLPALLWAQDLQFQIETDSIPVVMEGWNPYSPWAGGVSESNPAIIDIDADSDLDFLIGEYMGAIQYFRNDGSVVAADFALISLQFDSVMVSESRNNPCFRDMDNDGDQDLITSDIDSYVYYYRNDGTPFSPHYTFITNILVPLMTLVGPELIDIDADGDYDLFGGYYGQISFVRNNGSAQSYNFTVETNNFESIDVGDRALPDFVDIDADGDDDLFIGERYGKLWYYRNDGDSVNYNFTYMSDFYDSIDVGDYSSPEFADIDGDGDYDLFVGRESNAASLIGDVFFYENIGTPQNAEFQLVAKNYLMMDISIYEPRPQAIDIDADGTKELIAGAGNILDYFENTGDSLLPAFSFMEQGYQGISLPTIQPFFVDIDADSDYDLFCGQGAIPGPPSLALYLNQGTPRNPDLQLYSSQFITNPDFFVLIVPVLADIDADSDYDLFIFDSHDHFYFYENTGTPQWPIFVFITNQWQNIHQFPYPYDSWYGFTFADLDEDFDLDLLIRSPSAENIYLYRNQGTPQLPNMVLETEQLLSSSYHAIYTLYLMDIDSDADFDLLAGHINGGMLFFRNITGEVSAPPPVQRHPQAGLQISLGPNPANPNTVISFSLPFAQQIDLAVYNLLGARVATLASGPRLPGSYLIPWDASGNASGVYIIRLETPVESLSEKLTIVK